MFGRSLAIIGALAAASLGARHASRPIVLRARADRLGAARADDSLEIELTALERQSWVAWKARDGSFYQAFLSDDHVEVGSTGLASKSDVVGFVGSKACIVERYALDHFRLTHFDANAALLSYHAEQPTTCNGMAVPSPVWVSSLYVRRDGKWQNALYQQTAAEGK